MQLRSRPSSTRQLFRDAILRSRGKTAPVQSDVIGIPSVIVIDHVLPSRTEAEIEATSPTTLIIRRKAVAAKMAAKVLERPTARSRSGSSILKVLNIICSTMISIILMLIGKCIFEPYKVSFSHPFLIHYGSLPTPTTADKMLSSN